MCISCQDRGLASLIYRGLPPTDEKSTASGIQFGSRHSRLHTKQKGEQAKPATPAHRRIEVTGPTTALKTGDTDRRADRQTDTENHSVPEQTPSAEPEAAGTL